MIPILFPSLQVFRLPLPRFGLPGLPGGNVNIVDLLLAVLIGGIDTNPLLDLVLTPLAWAVTFFTS
jgi:hypothetical protein